MEPKIVDKTALRKARNDPAKKRSTDRDMTPDQRKEFLLAPMMQRILQALLDEVQGLSRKEIERRLELDPGDEDEMHQFGHAFNLLRDKGRLARTATGFKRGRSPVAANRGLRLGDPT